MQTVADLNVLAVSFEPAKGKSKPGMKFWSPTQPVCFMLSSEGTPAVIPWPASVFDGDGTETHLNLCLKVPDTVVAMIRNLENRAQQQSGAKEFNSCLKDGEILKTKVHVAGERCVRIWSAERKLVGADMLRTVRNQQVNAVIAVRGVYQSGRSCGLMLETTDLLLGQQEEPAFPF
jgi:hypothetical protein